MVQETENSAINIVKIEADDASDNEDNDKCVEIIDTDSTHATQPYQIGTGQENSLTRPTSLLSATATALNSSPPTIENKYCNVCDIKFKYLNSYIAHKESYCRNIPNDVDFDAVAANPATSVIATTCSSPNQTSVVT